MRHGNRHGRHAALIPRMLPANAASGRLAQGTDAMRGRSAEGHVTPTSDGKRGEGTGEEMRITGTWRISEMGVWDQESIDLMGPVFIEFGPDGAGHARDRSRHLLGQARHPCGQAGRRVTVPVTTGANPAMRGI